MSSVPFWFVSPLLTCPEGAPKGTEGDRGTRAPPLGDHEVVRKGGVSGPLSPPHGPFRSSFLLTVVHCHRSSVGFPLLSSLHPWNRMPVTPVRYSLLFPSLPLHGLWLSFTTLSPSIRRAAGRSPTGGRGTGWSGVSVTDGDPTGVE